MATLCETNLGARVNLRRVQRSLSFRGRAEIFDLKEASNPSVHMVDSVVTSPLLDAKARNY